MTTWIARKVALLCPSCGRHHDAETVLCPRCNEDNARRQRVHARAVRDRARQLAWSWAEAGFGELR